MQKWFFVSSSYGGCRYYRQVLPIRNLQPWLRERGVRVKLGSQMSEGLDADAIFFSRNIGAENLFYVLQMAAKEKLIVWDLDDDLTVREKWSRFASDPTWVEREIMSLYQGIASADIVTVSTPGLRNRMAEIGLESVVCRNAIDMKYDWKPSSRRGVHGWSVPRILYAGTPTHYEDLELVRRLYEKTSRAFDWFFFGCHPRWARRATLIPLSSIRDYPRVCRSVWPRFSLAPLSPSRFNESKSPIKVWEMATLGGSVVASNTGPYRLHPSAVVPEGEDFTEGHLWISTDSMQIARATAVDSSWSSPVGGRADWIALFDRVYRTVAGRRGESVDDPLEGVVSVAETS